MQKELNIKISVDKKTGDIKVVDGEFNELSRSVGKADRKVDGFNKQLMAIATGAVGVYAIATAFGVAARSASDFINTAAEFESFEATLRTIEGSSKKAEESMKWIEDFASTTPFNIDKVTSSFISLKSYGLDPTDGLLRTLGDTGAAMGKDIQQAVEAMADAVVGENERLKEFGIRASKMGEEIKYSWTNASGEMRQIVIDNNSAIIESTLSSIFNSKYAGAMEEQSRTWNGLIANMQDNWTIFQKNLMDSGFFDYLKAIVTVVGEYMSEAFGNTLESSAAFSSYVIEGIKSIIGSFGYAYDALETFGDYFSVIGLTAQLAFEGVLVGVIGLGSGIVNIFESVIDGINYGFEMLVNGVIYAINGVLDIAASLGFGSGGNIGTIDLGNVDVGGDFLKGYSDAANAVFLQTSKDLGLAWDDLMDANSGQQFTDSLLAGIDEVYGRIQNTPDITVEKKDFGDAVVPENANTMTTPENYIVDNINTEVGEISQNVTDSVQNVNDSLSGLSDTLYTNNNSDDTIYTAVNNTDDSFRTLNDTTAKTVQAVNNASYALDNFIFKFEDTFMNSISNNISSLGSVASSTAFSSPTSYSDALTSMLEAQSNLTANPLDVEIGQQFSNAYEQYIDSATAYLGNDNNFSNTQDRAYQAAVIANQSDAFRGSAVNTIDVLESMNGFLETISKAFSDGILSDTEKATIAGVADSVNTKNEKLLIGSNSVGSSINDLMGDATSGISLSSISSSLPALSVATGLDISDLSSISTNTSLTKGAVDTMAGGTSLLHLKIKSVSTRMSYIPTSGTTYYGVRNGVWGYYFAAGQATPSDNSGSTSETKYQYYAAGGFTGSGFGMADSTGFKPAGVVHEDEWVAPKWMVESNPALFGALEDSRKNGRVQGFADGGFTVSPITMPTIDVSHKKDNDLSSKEVLKELKEMRQIMNKQLQVQNEVILLKSS